MDYAACIKSDCPWAIFKRRGYKIWSTANRLIEFNWSFNDMPEISDIESEEATNKNTKKSILFIGRIRSIQRNF